MQTARIPSIDLIDFDYLPWHTADDTLDKLSAGEPADSRRRHGLLPEAKLPALSLSAA